MKNGFDVGVSVDRLDLFDIDRTCVLYVDRRLYLEGRLLHRRSLR